MTQLHSDPFLAKNVCHHSRVNGYFPPALYVLSQKGGKYMMNQQQLAASTDTQTSQSTVSILPNKNTFTKKNDKTNNEIINQNSQSTAIYHPKHGKLKTGGMAAWRGCEAHGRLLLLLLLNQLFIFLQEFPSRPQDVVTMVIMATMVTTSIQPGMDVGILMCTILHQGNEPREGKANMSWTHLGGFQNPRWKFVRLRPPNIGKEPRPPFVGLSGVASWHSTNHTVHAVFSCMVHLVYIPLKYFQIKSL